MSPSPCNAPLNPVRTFRPAPARILTALVAVVILLAALTGCGGGGEKDAVLATVGDAEIKASYYEDRLVRLEQNELPRAEDGTALDMSSYEGKREFLETLINKEIMVQTAENMGLENDPNIVTARDALSSYEASLVLWNRVIQEPANTISPEELEAFYAHMGAFRNCQYIICNFEDDAEEARRKALEGVDWEDIVNEFHDGGDPPSGVYEIQVPFGRYAPEFEEAVYGTEIGGITPPINSVYGYWVLKVLSEKPGKKPPLEEAKAQILDVTHVRKKSRLKKDFIDSVNKKFELTIHEDALWKCYQALPKGETLFREGTQDPRTKDELTPLDIATEDMDMPFYSYLGRNGKVEYTLLDYKTHFDKMSVFQRPKDSELLGGLRNKIKQELEKTLLNFEAEDRGLFEDPAVKGKVDIKIEEMIVGKLYSEVIVVDEQVSAEELEAFWAEHADEYYKKEERTGRLVVCADAALAAKAAAMAAEGAAWHEVMATYDVDPDNKARAGALENLVLREDDPVSVALFDLQLGAVSEPFAVDGGRYAVVRFDALEPWRPLEIYEANELIGRRIKERRKEALFQEKLAQWKEDIPVVVYEDRLDGVASWEELRTVQVPENVVPRN